MLDLKKLITTQISVRNKKQIVGMVKFIRGGGLFDRKSLDEFATKTGKSSAPLIQINEFEDGGLFVLDGHHRSIGIIEGGRNYLHETEYEIIQYTYKEFEDIVFLKEDGDWMGWVTPFDPRTHVRYSDTKKFKDRVREIYYSQSPDHAVHFIKTHPEMYCCLRSSLDNPIDTFEQLTEKWRIEMTEAVV